LWTSLAFAEKLPDLLLMQGTITQQFSKHLPHKIHHSSAGEKYKLVIVRTRSEQQACFMMNKNATNNHKQEDLHGSAICPCLLGKGKSFI